MKDIIVVLIWAIVGACFAVFMLSHDSQTYAVATLHTCMGVYAFMFGTLAFCYCTYKAMTAI